MKRLLFLLLLFLLSLSFCARTRRTGDSETTTETRRAESRPVEEGAAKQSRDEAVSKREIKPKSRQPEPSAQPQASNLKQTEEQRLLPLGSDAVQPEDFKIGLLAGLVETSRNEREIIKVTKRFLDGLREGRVLTDTLESSIAEELQSSIQYYLDKDLLPQEYRIGAITTTSKQQPVGESTTNPGEKTTAWMNVRFFGSPGVSEGEIYLADITGRWYVSDLQIDFEKLSEAYDREEEKYYPSIYGWGIQ